MASLRSNKSSVHTEEQPPQPEEQPALSLQQTPKGRKPSCLISVRAYPRIVAYCIALSLSALLTGYDVVIVGSITALPQFQHDYGQKLGGNFILPSLWLALWSAFTFFGQMVGSIIGGLAQDQIGRRTTLLIGSATSAAAVALCFVSYIPDGIDARRGIFLAGKTVMGAALGILMATSQTYISEITPVALRGPMLALLPIMTLLGQLIGAGLMYALSHNMTRKSYLIAIATQWVLSLLVLIAALITPESPAHLVGKRRFDAALRSLARLHTSRVDLPAKLEQIRQLVIREEQFSKCHTYLDCFNSQHRRQTMIVLFAGIIPQLFGLSILSQASYFMQLIGMTAPLSLAVLCLGIVLGLAANIAGIWTMSCFGRRMLILASLQVSALLWLAMGIAGVWPGIVTMWYSAGTMMAIVVANGLGAWPASFTVAGETSSLLLRAKTQGLNWFANSFFSGIVSLTLPYIYNPDAGDLGAKIGFVFAGLCAIGTYISWLIIPEMKGRGHAEIERMFSLGVPTRAFGRWSGTEEMRELQ